MLTYPNLPQDDVEDHVQIQPTIWNSYLFDFNVDRHREEKTSRALIQKISDD